MDSVVDRLREILDRDGVSMTELARRVNYSEGAVRGWFKSGKLKQRAIQPISDALSISAEWLEFGTGSPDDDDAPSDEAMALARAYDDIDDDRAKHAIRELIHVVHDMATDPPAARRALERRRQDT